MKLAKKDAGTLAANNKSLLAKHANDKLSASPYYPILLLWAEMLDQAASGDNCYFIAGTTRAKSNVTLKMIVNDDAETVYAAGLFELASEVVIWLQTA